MYNKNMYYTMIFECIRGFIMNLKPCRDCGRNVSASATNCPHCGANDPTNAQAIATGIA
jgi:predicted amidophosphoribosyltransferase